MLHRLFIILIASFCSFPLMAQKTPKDQAPKDEVVFFARVVPEREQLFAGDSCLVNIVLYSSHDFADVEKKPEVVTVKGGRARLLPRRSSPVPFRVQMEEGIFNAVVWQQYVVGRDDVGNIRFSTPTFNATFAIIEMSDDPFERFFGFGQRNQRLVKAKCKLDAFTLPVVERPKRSSQDILQSGGSLI